MVDSSLLDLSTFVVALYFILCLIPNVKDVFGGNRLALRIDQLDLFRRRDDMDSGPMNEQETAIDGCLEQARSIGPEGQNLFRCGTARGGPEPGPRRLSC